MFPFILQSNDLWHKKRGSQAPFSTSFDAYFSPHCEGGIPKRFLKTRVKYFGSEKPTM